MKEEETQQRSSEKTKLIPRQQPHQEGAIWIAGLQA
jgi:hypothetical protein